MSEEDQASAIGHAIQAAAASRKQLLALAAEIERAGESFRIAYEGLRELLANNDTKGHDVYKALKSIPDLKKLKERISEYEDVAARHAGLAERARQLSEL